MRQSAHERKTGKNFLLESQKTFAIHSWFLEECKSEVKEDEIQCTTKMRHNQIKQFQPDARIWTLQDKVVPHQTQIRPTNRA